MSPPSRPSACQPKLARDPLARGAFSQFFSNFVQFGTNDRYPVE